MSAAPLRTPANTTPENPPTTPTTRPANGPRTTPKDMPKTMPKTSLRAALRPRRTGGWVLLLAAVFSVLQLANVSGRDTPDTKNYLSYTLSLLGQDKREAAGITIEYACAGQASVARRAQSVDVERFHRASPSKDVTATCRSDHWKAVGERLKAGQTAGHTTPFMSERFQRIFEVRPGYPAFLVPFVALLGVKWGLWAAGVTITASCGVLAFLVLRTLRVRRALALTGQALFHVLPCGATAMRPMTEGLLLLFTLTALWGCALVLRGRGWPGTVLVSLSLAALFTVKHSQALFLGLCLAAAGLAVALRRLRSRRPMGRGVVAVVAASAYGALATVVAAWALDHPSTTDSVQDLLTDHFQRPDRADPWREFLHLELNFWVEWTRRQLWEPLFAAALAAGAWGALRRRPAFGVFLLAAAATGMLTQAAHPDITIWGGRLFVLAWLLPVVGLPLLLECLTTRQGPFTPVSVPLRFPVPATTVERLPVTPSPRRAPAGPADFADLADGADATPVENATGAAGVPGPAPAAAPPGPRAPRPAGPHAEGRAGRKGTGLPPRRTASARALTAAPHHPPAHLAPLAVTDGTAHPGPAAPRQPPAQPQPQAKTQPQPQPEAQPQPQPQPEADARPRPQPEQSPAQDPGGPAT